MDRIRDNACVIRCGGGLCNRLFHLGFGLTLCNLTGRLPFVEWITDSQCGATFHDVLDTDLPEIGAMDYLSDSPVFMVNGCSEATPYPSIRHDDPNLLLRIAEIPRSVLVIIHYPWGDMDFRDTYVATVLNRASFHTRYDQTARDFIHANRVAAAVHLRGTDCWIARNGLPPQQIEELVLGCIRKLSKDEERLYVSSGDAALEAIAVSSSPRVITRPKTFVEKLDASRPWLIIEEESGAHLYNVHRSAEQVDSALLDLHILSHVPHADSTFPQSSFFQWARAMQRIRFGARR